MHVDYSIVARVGISLTVFLSTYGAVRLFTSMQRRRLRGQEIDAPPGSAPVSDSPRLLYFWTEECVQCRVQEREIERALERLDRSGRLLTVNKLNAHQEKALTEKLRVMTVPTTVLLSSAGSVVGWNPGLTKASRIVEEYSKAVSALD